MKHRFVSGHPQLLLFAQPLPSWEELLPLLRGLVPNVLQALLVLAITLYLAGLSRRAFLHASVKSNADVNTRYLVARLLYLGVLFLGLATVLAIFEVPLTAVAAFIGVIGLGISLALQDILKNFFAGLYLLFERPFRIGEHIRVKDFEGRVEDIGVRTTNLRTVDNAEVLIPNAIVFAEIVSNRTRVRQGPGEAAPGAQKAAVAAGALPHGGQTGSGPAYGDLGENLEQSHRPSPPPDVAP